MTESVVGFSVGVLMLILWCFWWTKFPWIDDK